MAKPMSDCLGQVEINYVVETSTFFIRKNKETVENCLQMTVELKFTLKVIKANLIFNKIRLNIPFTTLPFHGHFICFYELHLRFKSKTMILIYKGNNVIKNIKCSIVFEFRAKFFGQELLGFRQPNLIECLYEGQVDRNIFLLLCRDVAKEKLSRLFYCTFKISQCLLSPEQFEVVVRSF